MSRKITLTALLMVAFLVTVIGLAACWILMPLGGLIWAAGMGWCGYAVLDATACIWRLNECETV